MLLINHLLNTKNNENVKKVKLIDSSSVMSPLKEAPRKTYNPDMNIVYNNINDKEYIFGKTDLNYEPNLNNKPNNNINNNNLINETVNYSKRSIYFRGLVKIKKEVAKKEYVRDFRQSDIFKIVN